MSRQMNYNHLRYFYTVARKGSIAKASEELHVSPQTISGQLTIFEEYLGISLFDRKGKRLVLNDMGKLVYNYAEDIFALGTALQQSIKAKDLSQQFVFTAGIVDVIPKVLAAGILEHGFELDGPVKLVCKEGDLDTLLADLALNKTDFILSDRPLSSGIAVKAYSHFLGECGLSFCADKSTAKKLQKDFPQSLHKHPFLICGDKASQKASLHAWFDTEQIHPKIVAEFDDSALMKFFGQAGHGVFAIPTMIEGHVLRQYDVSVIGRTDAIKERFYAISPERKVKHPGVKLLLESAQKIFAEARDD